MKTLRLFVGVIILFCLHTGYAENISSGSANSKVVQNIVNVKKNNAKTEKYDAYKIDGYASASKLAAQRSHTVAGEDERNFAVFTGIVAVIIVYIFTRIVFFDR